MHDDEVENNRLVQTIAQRVKMYRQAAGLSQRELALLARMKQSHLSRLESGRHVPSLLVLLRVGRALRMNPRNFLAPHFGLPEPLDDGETCFDCTLPDESPCPHCGGSVEDTSM